MRPANGAPWPDAVTDFAPRRQRLLIWLALTGLALLITVARLRTYSEPLETDITNYLVVADEVLRGKHLYTEVWDHKPPGVFVAYAVALAVARDAPERAVYLMGVLCAIVTMLGVFRAGRSLAGDRTALLAAAAWAVVCGDLRTQANQPNVEVFMNAAHIWALALLLEAVRPAHRFLVLAAGAGALLGLAAVFKHVSFALVPFLAAAVAGVALRAADRRKPLTAAVLMSATSTWAWALAVAWFAARSQWFYFRAAMFDFNAYYASLDGGGILKNIAAGLAPARLLPAEMMALLPLALTALAGLIGWAAVCRRVSPGKWRQFAVLAAFAAGTFFVVVLPGRFYPHYYQLWLPLLCVAAAAGAAALGRAAPAMILARPQVIGGVLLLALLGTQAPTYLLTADEWSQRKYGPGFVQGRDMGRMVRNLLRAGETLFVWGQYSGFYVYSGARPATGFFFLTPLLWSPHAELHSTRALQDLKSAPPEMILEDRRDVPSYPNHPVVRWFNTAYIALPTGTLGQARYRVWCLRGGALAQRLGLEEGAAP